MTPEQRDEWARITRLALDGMETAHCPSQQEIIIRKAHSMDIFADGDATITLGEWRAWEAACLQENRRIPPAEFKSWPDHKRMAYRTIHSAVKL